MKKVLGILGAAALACGVAAQSANADSDLKVFEIDNWAPGEFFSFGEPTSNPTINWFFSPGTIITGIAWDLNITANDPAWLSDFQFGGMAIENAEAGSGIFIRPAVGVNQPGQGQFSSDGILKFADAGIPDIVLTSGHLYVEGFDIFPGDPGLKNISGTITFQYVGEKLPAPGALALLGIAGLAGVRRRRN